MGKDWTVLWLGAAAAGMRLNRDGLVLGLDMGGACLWRSCGRDGEGLELGLCWSGEGLGCGLGWTGEGLGSGWA